MIGKLATSQDALFREILSFLGCIANECKECRDRRCDTCYSPMAKLLHSSLKMECARRHRELEKRLSGETLAILAQIREKHGDPIREDAINAATLEPRKKKAILSQLVAFCLIGVEKRPDERKLYYYDTTQRQ